MEQTLIQIANPRIGVTERGDAGRNLSWALKLADGKADMAILITKCITAAFIDKVVQMHKAGYSLIVHCGCTGLGGTVIEPGSPAPNVQLASLKMLLNRGFPIEHCVLRIDPIIPTDDGLAAARRVLDMANAMFDMSKLRVRVSVVDDYRHVKARFHEAGLPTIYPGDRFYANRAEFARVAALFADFPAITFETCAEKYLAGLNIVAKGCVSDTDLAICGIRRNTESYVNPQNRSGCLCLGNKMELLTEKRQCASRCLYCYWQTPAAAPRA